MTALVTGAYGFLGRHVARRLALRGYCVRGIGHGHWSPGEWETWGIAEWREADVTLQTLREFARAPDVIFHCAGSGSVSLSFSDPLNDFQRTVDTTAGVLEYVRLHSPSTRVIYTSSASAYGVAETFPIREDSPRAPISPYGEHKCMAEQLIETYCRHFGVAASIVRLFSVYGSGLRKQLLWDACRKLSTSDFTFKGTGCEIRDWLHVGDAVDLLIVAADNSSSGCPIVNGGTGEGVSVRTVLLQCAQALGLESPNLRFSGIPGVGDPERFVADKALAHRWNWSPRMDWKTGIAEYCAWWHDQMKNDHLQYIREDLRTIARGATR